MESKRKLEESSLIMVDYAASDPRSMKAWLRARAQGRVRMEFDGYLASLDKRGNNAVVAACRPAASAPRRFRRSTIVGMTLGLAMAVMLSSWIW